MDVKNRFIYKTRKKKISVVAGWAFIGILYTLCISGRRFALPCEYSAYYSEFFTHNLSSLGSELPLNHWSFMPEWFHLATSSWSPLDLQKFTEKSVGCLGNSGGNASCCGEKCTLWQFGGFVASEFQNMFQHLFVLNCRKISRKRSDNKIS